MPYLIKTYLNRSTHAWILSGGTNTGSMKLVGEAVKEGQFLVQDGTGKKIISCLFHIATIGSSNTFIKDNKRITNFLNEIFAAHASIFR